jgi:RNA polymerase sigma-70 factor (ECF subfamily)
VDRDARFTTTRWNVVLRARAGEDAQSRDALASLCEAYWYPLYVFVRRQGFQADEALDLT